MLHLFFCSVSTNESILFLMKTLDSVQLDTYRMTYVICWWMAYIFLIVLVFYATTRLILTYLGDIFFLLKWATYFRYNHITKLSVRSEEQ